MPGRKQGKGSRLKAENRHAEARIKRATARIVSTNSHRDREKSESVNTLTSGQVLHDLIDKLPTYRTSTLLPATELFEKGEVISDARGEGSQQGTIII